MGKHSPMVRVIICATSKLNKIKYLRGKIKSCKCLFWECFSLTTFPSRLGRTITFIWEVAMETNLYCSPFAVIFFSDMLYLSKILTAVKQTLNPRGLKNRICIFSPDPLPHPFKGMTIDKLRAHGFHQQWSIFYTDRCWQRGCHVDEGRAVTASLQVSWDHSPTCHGHRCSVLVWRIRATHHTWKNTRNTELLLINIKMIKQVV